MLSAVMKGRLGNQLFQIATTYSLSLDISCDIIFPKRVFGASPTSEEKNNYKNNILRNVDYTDDLSFVTSVWREPSFQYTKIPQKDNMILDGYFQSEKYFAHNSDKVKEYFSPTDEILEQISKYEFDESGVAVHVRRGDYVKLSHVHTNLAEHTSYYQDATRLFPDQQKIFFSDDIEWCKSNFKGNNLYINTGNDVIDFFLMSKIKNKIIANSSFSWWPAWIGEQEDSKIIAPKMWFRNTTSTKDLIPKRWLEI